MKFSFPNKSLDIQSQVSSILADKSESPHPVFVAVSQDGKDEGRKEALDEIMECIDEEVECQPLEKQGDTLNKFAALLKIPEIRAAISKRRKAIADKFKRREELLNIPPSDRVIYAVAEKGGMVQVTQGEIRNIGA